VTGSEDHHLKLFRGLFQAFTPVGTDVDPRAYYVLGVTLLPKIDFKDDIR
jgi:hypothetical protein